MAEDNKKHSIIAGELKDLVNSSRGKIEDDINEISFRTSYSSNNGRLMSDISRYRDALSRLSLESQEKYMTLLEIDFSKITEIFSVRESLADKPSKSIESRKLFLDDYLIPALCNRYYLVGDELYFKTSFGAWKKIGTRDDLLVIIRLSCLMLPELKVTAASNILSAVTESVLLTMSSKSNVNAFGSEIQFNDCVFRPDEGLVDDYPKSFPRFIFNVDVWDDFNSVEPVPEVDELLDHVCEGDADTKRCLIDRLSMAFITDAKKKVLLDAKVVMLYGSKGQNGKSTLANLFKRALNNENVCAFSFGNFKGYDLASVEGNLALVDMEASSQHVSPEVSTAIKMAVTADEMRIRQIYQQPRSVIPLVQILVCTNAAPKAEDKTRGWERRLEWYEVNAFLEKPKEWFERLNSDAAARYFRATLLRNASKLIKMNQAIKPSEKILMSNRKYIDINKNVLIWLETESTQRGCSVKSFIEDRATGDIRNMYEVWCEENHETQLGPTNFNAIIESETGLVKKVAVASPSLRSEAFKWWQSQGDITSKLNAANCRVQCWVSND